MSVLLNILRLFMQKQIVCLCVYFICTAGCVWSLGCRSGYRLQVPGEHCALAAQKQVAESPGWEVAMCSESCWALLLREMVNLPSSISFTTECMSTKNVGALPGYCWYHRKQLLALFSQLQFRMEISPSWTVKDRGLCFTCCWSLFSFCCPFTPV